MDFIRVAPFVDIWPPFMSVRLNSKRDLPVSKLILPSMVMVLLETSVVCISNPAEKAWLSPNSLPVAPPKCGPPGGPDCEYAGRSPRQITAEASIENCFFIVREWVFARFNFKLRKMQFLPEPFPQAVKLVVQRFRQMTAKPGVIRSHAFSLFFPARNVHHEQLLEAVGGQVQAG